MAINRIRNKRHKQTKWLLLYLLSGPPGGRKPWGPAEDGTATGIVPGGGGGLLLLVAGGNGAAK